MNEHENKAIQAFDRHAVHCPTCGNLCSPVCCPLGMILLAKAERAMHMVLAAETRVQ